MNQVINTISNSSQSNWANYRAAALLLLVFASASFQQIGIDFNNTLLKFLAVGALASAYFIAVHILMGNTLGFKLARPIFLIVVLSFYPLLCIGIAVASDLSFKQFTDGYIIFGSYYFLPILSLAFIVAFLRGQAQKIIVLFSLASAPLVVLMAKIGYGAETPQFYGHIIIDNFCIPLAFFLLLDGWRRVNILGLVGLCAIGVVGSMVGSRSYLILFAMFVVAFFLNYEKGGSRFGIMIMLVISAALSVAVVVKASSLVSLVGFHSGSTIQEKFMFTTLSSAFEEAVRKKDILELYYWEGNSRADVVKSAFSEMNSVERLFGKGIFGKYEMNMGGVTIARSTIEIGWIQELFRWGVVQLAIVFSAILIAFKRLMSGNGLGRGFGIAVVSFLAIKFLDSWTYGLAVNSNYSMLFYACLLLAIYPKAFGSHVGPIGLRFKAESKSHA